MSDDPPLLDDEPTRRERRTRKARRRNAFGVGILATFAIVLSVVTVTIFFVTGASVHYTAQSALEEELGRRLLSAAALTAHLVEGESGPEGAGLVVKLLAEGNAAIRSDVAGTALLARAASGARDVLVCDPQGRLLATASSPGTPENASSAAQVAAHRATIQQVVATKKAACTPLYFLPGAPSASEGRFYKSAYAPLVVGDGVALLVGIDCPADFTESVERVDDRFTVLGAGAFFSVLASAVLLVRQRVGVPIYRLVRAMEGGDDGEARPQRVRVRWRDEIGALTEHYNRMVDRLQAQEAELRTLYDAAQRKAEFLGGYSKYLVEGVPSAVVAVDPEGRVTVWNEGAQRILGKGPEVVGQPMSAVLPDHPVARALARALAGEKSDEALVALGAPGDAEAGEADQDEAGARLVELTAGPLRNPERGELLGAAALVHDRTELERLRRAAARNERLAAVGRLAAGLAHEIRNPLAAISGFAELIERKKGQDDAVRLASRLRGEVDELNRFLTEFLSFARDQRIKRAPEDLNELLRRAAETALRAAGFSVDETRRALEGDPVPRPEGGELRVAIEGDPGLAAVPIDATAFKAALVNVIKNALEAMRGRGGLALRARRSNDRAVVRVRDSGPGVPPELREKIFDPFFTTRDNGVGLGLAIAHKFVVAHGGKIAVRAPDEGGCEFVIRLPLSADAPRDASSSVSAIEDDATPHHGAHLGTV